MDTINSGKQLKGTKKRSYADEERQKSISIASTQEEEHMQKSIGCRIRMLVGYGDSDKMNATIITTKEDVDHQFRYPKRNKVIKEYKYIKGSYSWDDEFEIESESAKSTNSPKIYDLRTPQKKSRLMEMVFDVAYTKKVFWILNLSNLPLLQNLYCSLLQNILMFLLWILSY